MVTMRAENRCSLMLDDLKPISGGIQRLVQCTWSTRLLYQHDAVLMLLRRKNEKMRQWTHQRDDPFLSHMDIAFFCIEHQEIIV